MLSDTRCRITNRTMENLVLIMGKNSYTEFSMLESFVYAVYIFINVRSNVSDFPIVTRDTQV